MAQHIDNVNHNVYWDGVTLTNCTYVRCGEGTTGTITNSNYLEIGHNNSVTVQDSSYVSIGDNNSEIYLNDAHYIIVGSNNTSISIGEQRDPDSGITRTGANSVSVSRNTLQLDVTGRSMRIHKTKFGQLDGYFNEMDNSGSVIIKNGTGNQLDQSRTVELIETNNNTIAADNISLEKKDAFIEYSKVNSAIKAEPSVMPIDRQSDNEGTVLYTQEQKLINKETDSLTKDVYTKINGVWSKVEVVK